ncbi:MAG: HAD family hydrolase [Clostridia bacterium]|nr:HAD family hydrolase [Clostridia bacterium]
MITTVLFDLDGTLLPMDNDVFTKGYFKFLVKKLSPHGYDPQQLVDGIWAGTAAMVKNDGACTNEEVFWKKFSSVFGDMCLEDKPVFDEFYKCEFKLARDFCGFNPKAREAVNTAKARGLRTALATNPIFPAVATEIRIGWAGLDVSDFELYTTYENSRFCKPSLSYYREILQKLSCGAEECLMVGNDADEDMIATELGMQVFLLTDCLINKSSKDLADCPQGGFDELIKFIKNI